eukprot:10144047-Alexandrium_andersonii.AAC.1
MMLLYGYSHVAVLARQELMGFHAVCSRCLVTTGGMRCEVSTELVMPDRSKRPCAGVGGVE